MVLSKAELKKGSAQQFWIRKLTKAGGSRYLSIGTLIPTDWQVVKVYLEKQTEGVCVLRLVQIK